MGKPEKSQRREVQEYCFLFKFTNEDHDIIASGKIMPIISGYLVYKVCKI